MRYICNRELGVSLVVGEDNYASFLFKDGKFDDWQLTSTQREMLKERVDNLINDLGFEGILFRLDNDDINIPGLRPLESSGCATSTIEAVTPRDTKEFLCLQASALETELKRFPDNPKLTTQLDQTRERLDRMVMNGHSN